MKKVVLVTLMTLFLLGCSGGGSEGKIEDVSSKTSTYNDKDKSEERIDYEVKKSKELLGITDEYLDNLQTDDFDEHYKVAARNSYRNRIFRDMNSALSIYAAVNGTYKLEDFSSIEHDGKIVAYKGKLSINDFVSMGTIGSVEDNKFNDPTTENFIDVYYYMTSDQKKIGIQICLEPEEKSGGGYKSNVLSNVTGRLHFGDISIDCDNFYE